MVARSEQECKSSREFPRTRLETTGQANRETHLVNCYRRHLRNPDLLVDSGPCNHAADILLRPPIGFPGFSNCKPFSLVHSCSIIAIWFIVAIFNIIRGGHIRICSFNRLLSFIESERHKLHSGLRRSRQRKLCSSLYCGQQDRLVRHSFLTSIIERSLPIPGFLLGLLQHGNC